MLEELRGLHDGQNLGQPHKIVHIASHFNADPAASRPIVNN